MKRMLPHVPRRVCAGRVADRGAVLVVVMMVMMGVLGLGVTAMWLTSGNLQVGANTNQRMLALYAAEAGLERARSVFNTPTAPNMTLILTGTAHVDNNPVTGLDTAGRANGVGVVLWDGPATPLAGVVYPPASFGRTGGSTTAPTSATMGTYTVWVRNDNAELRMVPMMTTTDLNQMVVARSQGLAPDGRTRVVLEVTLVPTVRITTPPPVDGGGELENCAAGKNACAENSNTISNVSY